MRVPDVVSDPADLFGEFHRPAAEMRQAVFLLVERFCKVRVRVHAGAARELNALAHEVLGNRKRRARSDHNPRHRQRRRIVIRVDDALRILQNESFVFDDIVGRSIDVVQPESMSSAIAICVETRIASGVKRPHSG